MTFPFPSPKNMHPSPPGVKWNRKGLEGENEPRYYSQTGHFDFA